MSTKTTIKRIALVAVSALGFGVLTSVSPANAVDTVTASDITSVTAYGSTARVDDPALVQVKFAGGGIDTGEIMSVAARFQSKPAGSALVAGTAITFTEVLNGVYDLTGGDNDGSTEIELTGENEIWVNVNFTPDVAGTYVVRVFHDSNEDGTFAAGNDYVDATITTTGSPTKITLTNLSGTGVIDDEGESIGGTLIKVALTDSNGKATRLDAGEVLNITGSDFVYGDDSDDASAAANAKTTLSKSDFGLDGTAVLHVVLVAATTTLKIAGDGGSISANVNKSITLSAKAPTDAIATGLAIKSTSVDGADPDYTVATSGTSVSVTISGVTADADNSLYTPYVVSDFDTSLYASKGQSALGNGGSTRVGQLELVATKVATVAATKTSVDVAISYSRASATGKDAAGATYAASFDVSPIDNVNLEGVVADTLTFDVALSAAETVAFSATSIRAIQKGAVTLEVTAEDQFGNAYEGDSVTFTVTAGRNAGLTKRVVTDANGKANWTFTDAATFAGSTDTVTVESSVSGDTDSATITYYETIVPTITIEGPTDSTAISTTDADSVTATVSITVVDEAGAAIQGAKVVWAATGADITTDADVSYTDASGETSTTVWTKKTGTASVTATVLGKTASQSVKFKNATSDARVVSVKAEDKLVSATVTDGYGNPVAGVTVDFSRTGSGVFGTGLPTTTATTNTSGVAEVLFTGSATVTAKLNADTYTQVDDIADYIGNTAAAGTKNAGLPAGIGSASVEVSTSDTATDSVDAANEATDAANAATDAANAAAEAADAATAAAQDAQAAVAELATKVAALISGIKAQITTLTNLVIKIQKKVRA